MIWRKKALDLKDYGGIPALPPLCEGEVARVSAVHKERYALVCDRGECYGRLKSGVFYNGGAEPFPTTGDYVLIRNIAGTSFKNVQIYLFLEMKSSSTKASAVFVIIMVTTFLITALVLFLKSRESKGKLQKGKG